MKNESRQGLLDQSPKHFRSRGDQNSRRDLTRYVLSIELLRQNLQNVTRIEVYSYLQACLDSLNTARLLFFTGIFALRARHAVWRRCNGCSRSQNIREPRTGFGLVV